MFNKTVFFILVLMFPQVLNAEVAGVWSKFMRSSGYVMTGQYGVAGDPSIIKINDQYHMFYGCFDPNRKPQGTDVCRATSKDGIKWELPNTGNLAVLGQVTKPDVNSWHTANETPFILSFQGKYWLYFNGYKDKGGIFNSLPASLGLAISTDGIKFELQNTPVLQPDQAGYDQSAIVSPSIVNSNGKLYMVYTAFCLKSSCVPKTGTALMMATSSDGVHWQKLPKPIIDTSVALPDFVRSAYELAEPELILGPDNFYYLFFTATQGDKPHMIGVARSANPSGPWTFNPEPVMIVQPSETEVVAPNVRIEGNKVRMWFSAFTTKPSIHIAYAEAAWPLFVGK